MRSMPSNCRCCDAELEHGGKLCQSCREDLSSSLYNVPTLLKAWNSYSTHFGPRAVEAAEQDRLGEALELLRAIVGNRSNCFIPTTGDKAIGTIDWDNRVLSFLSTTTKGNA